MRALTTLAFLAALLLPGCLSVAWRRERRYEPLPEGALAGLAAGRTTLAECLGRLGAPLYVWEYKADGAALAWGWSDADDKGVSISIPLQDYYSASLSYDDARARLRGAVLLFDPDLVLVQVREGWLRDIEREIGRRRPAAAESASGP